ncbi:MAG: LPS export ABC transporter periplasmic protein LptC [Candidatus Bipolaricaulia bacterium]
MSRTAKAGSLVMIVGLGVLILWLWASLPTLWPEMTLQSPAISAEGARIIKYDAQGKRLWELEADSMHVTESDSMAERIVLRFFDSDGRETLTVRAPQARLPNRTGDIELLGPLVATGSEFSFTTENLFWDNEKRLLSTPSAVRIERDDFTLIGRGLEYSSETGLVTILGEAQLTLRARGRERE